MHEYSPIEDEQMHAGTQLHQFCPRDKYKQFTLPWNVGKTVNRVIRTVRKYCYLQMLFLDCCSNSSNDKNSSNLHGEMEITDCKANTKNKSYASQCYIIFNNFKHN